jgi:hypothetical protein
MVDQQRLGALRAITAAPIGKPTAPCAAALFIAAATASATINRVGDGEDCAAVPVWLVYAVVLE